MNETLLSRRRWAILVLLVICLYSLSAQGKYGGGTGEPNGPYLIYDANHMQAIGADANDWDKHFILMADIDLSAYTGTSFNIIGNDIDKFTGVFDGNSHTISNFAYTSTGAVDIGLFGYVSQCEIKNLGLIDPDVDAGTGDYVGSLVGRNFGTISNCYSNGSVAGGSNVGGLVGFNRGTITHCYSEADVSGNEKVGGLVGYNNDRTITYCYSAGSVSGTTDVGGLVGYGYSGTVSSFWDIETSGQLSSAGGGSGRTTAQMQTASTYLGWNGCGEIIWTIDDGNDYPRLLWEARSGQPLPEHQLGDVLQGNGSELDPYLVYTADQLNMIGLFLCEWDKYFKLMADIDLSGFTGTEFNIIGEWRNAFTGVFDGNDHTISNFAYTSTATSFIGFFGNVSQCEIKNLGLIDPNVDAGTGSKVGSLVGQINGGTITNCYAEGGNVSGTGLSVGGLVGLNTGTISNCYSNGSVAGGFNVGGLVGYIYKGTITYCYSAGSVTGNEKVGGLVSENYQASITNCYATCNVSGDDIVGGAVGSNYEGIITNCHSTGRVSGTTDVGGLVGYNNGSVTDSFWDVNTSGQLISGGGTGLPTVEMLMQSTFTNWDFTNIWDICEGTNYPRFIWEIPEGDFLCPYGVNFLDFSFFAGHWQEDSCGASNDCDGTDLDQLGRVDANDLSIFVDNWLIGVKLPDQASNPNPTDGAISVSRTADLSWIAGLYAISHDVYFGTSNPPPFICNQTTTIFDPGTMDYNTTYYWRIDELNNTGTTTGVIWSFTTLSSPPPPPPP
jgi:hypothetical protein